MKSSDYVKEGARLDNKHLELLTDSAINPEVSRTRGYRTISTKAELARYGFSTAQRITPTMLIPLHNVRGQLGGYQHRPDQPRVATSKTVKYETASKMRMILDVHPFLSCPRVERNENPQTPAEAEPRKQLPLIADPTIPLFITEGVRKGDSAVSIGLCCIALLGVWNWRGSNEAGGKTALADWESIALKGRAVYLAFDSDVMENRKVYSALTRLKAFLESHKATLKLIYLPAGEHGEKVGLDDFIAREKTAGRGDAEIRDALLALGTNRLREFPKLPTELPEILILPGHIPQIVDEAETVLVANAGWLKLFQSGSEIVRIIALEQKSTNFGLIRPAGTVQLAAASVLGLQETLERLILWKRPDGEDVKGADCPPRVPQTYLARIGNWNLPVLTGVIEAPIMRPDRSILTAPGHDESTGLFLYADAEWPAVPEQPTREEAENALRQLIEPFAEFPFVDQAARSVLLAAILTGIQRRLLESSPLFGFDAPGQRSGKSLQAEAVVIIATGRKPPSTGVARTDDELRKAITSALREGQAIVNLDNITRPLDSPDLARALTQAEYSDRLLGVNKMLRLRTNVLWTATGNNLTFKGDMPSRALVGRIDAKMERPEEREFQIFDLPTHLLEHRKELVTAALTILRAYHVAGRPRQAVPRWGGFDQWSREIREPLVWLGMADPCRTRERVIVSDPERDAALSILAAWRDTFGDRSMPVARVIMEAGPELKASLLIVAADRNDQGRIDPRRLGAWCRMTEDRMFGDFCLSRAGSVRHAAFWKVSFVSSVSSKPSGPNGATNKLPAENGRADEGVCTSDALEQPGTNSPDSPDSPGGEIEEGSL